jgi:hypothetical protein
MLYPSTAVCLRAATRAAKLPYGRAYQLWPTRFVYLAGRLYPDFALRPCSIGHRNADWGFGGTTSSLGEKDPTAILG